MNLHVTNDENGLFPREIALRIKNSGKTGTNMMVNLCTSSEIRDDIITYIPISSRAITKYMNGIKKLDKIIFHPYNINSYRVLKIALEKFPHVKVYWVCWSYELYNMPHMQESLYDPFSANYLKKELSLKVKSANAVRKLILHFSHATRIRQPYYEVLNASYPLIDYFCSMLPSDFSFFQSLSANEKTKYIPFAYLSLENLMPGLTNFRSQGNKIMIGHSSSPQGNHYEIIEKLGEIDPQFSIFLPLAYGDKVYAATIKKHAAAKFKNLDVLETKMESAAYSKKLTEVGWVVINVKVQQALGNLLALVWMGVKIFLDENTSTYKDFSNWGIVVYSIQQQLNATELSNKLSDQQVENNRARILERFNEGKVSSYWENILN